MGSQPQSLTTITDMGKIFLTTFFFLTFFSFSHGGKTCLIKTADEVEDHPYTIKVNVNDESDGMDIIPTHLKGEALKEFKKLSLEEQMKEARKVEEKLREAKKSGQDYGYLRMEFCYKCGINNGRK